MTAGHQFHLELPDQTAHGGERPCSASADVEGSARPLPGQGRHPTARDVEQRSQQFEARVLIVHPSRLFRDCLKKALRQSVDYQILDFSEIEEAAAALASSNVALLLVGFAGGAAHPERLDSVLAQVSRGVPVVVSGDSEDPKYVVDLLNRGINGYLPTSLDLNVTIQALGLILAGGTFAPAACLLKLWQSTASGPPKVSTPQNLTSKQLAVIEAIRRGKPNKTIAYELNMCESTVKVHVRNIMKKLKAKNRTHVAYIANQLIGRDAHRDGAGPETAVTALLETGWTGADAWHDGATARRV